MVMCLFVGSIVVQSEKGKGTTFIVTVRCDFASEEEIKQAVSSSPSLSRRNSANELDINSDHPAETDGSDEWASAIYDCMVHKKILVVDDNTINQRVLSNFLSNLALKHIIVSNGQQAVEEYLAQQNSVSLIFMDVEMPFMNGYDGT